MQSPAGQSQIASPSAAAARSGQSDPGVPFQLQQKLQIHKGTAQHSTAQHKTAQHSTAGLHKQSALSKRCGGVDTSVALVCLHNLIVKGAYWHLSLQQLLGQPVLHVI